MLSREALLFLHTVIHVVLHRRECKWTLVEEKMRTVHSRVNVHNLATTSVPFTLTTLHVPNLGLTHTKRITMYSFVPWVVRFWPTLSRTATLRTFRFEPVSKVNDRVQTLLKYKIIM